MSAEEKEVPKEEIQLDENKEEYIMVCGLSEPEKCGLSKPDPSEKYGSNELLSE